MSRACLIRPNVREMAAYTPGEQIHAPGWVKLNTNENPYGPAPAVTEFLRTFDARSLRLYPDPLCVAPRRRIGEMHGCDPEMVFAGNGSDEILALCTRAFVGDDRAVAFFEPSYSLYGVLAAIRGVPARAAALGPDYAWRDPETEDAGLFFLTSPNAPTGTGFPRERIEVFCRRFPGVVVIDEAYADFADGDCMDLALKMPNVLVLRTLSKAYALAAIRFGYAVGDRELIAALFKIKDSYNVNALTQGAALAALSDTGYLRGTVARIRRGRTRLDAFLRSRGWKVYPSQTNFLWVRPPPEHGARRMFEMLRAERILTRWFPGEATENCLRITVGAEKEIDRLMAVLEGLEPLRLQ